MFLSQIIFLDFNSTWYFLVSCYCLWNTMYMILNVSSLVSVLCFGFMVIDISIPYHVCFVFLLYMFSALSRSENLYQQI